MTQRTEMTVIQHSDYQRKTRDMDESALRFVIADCQNAIEAMPDSPKVGYYTDEIHYCCMELGRRKNLV